MNILNLPQCCPSSPPQAKFEGALQELTGTPVCQPSIFGTCLHHPPCIQNSNQVGIHDRLQAMSHHQHGTILELLLKCLESGDAGVSVGSVGYAPKVFSCLLFFHLTHSQTRSAMLNMLHREPGTLLLGYLSRSVEPSTLLYLQLCHDMCTVRLILYLTDVYVSAVCSVAYSVQRNVHSTALVHRPGNRHRHIDGGTWTQRHISRDTSANIDILRYT